VDSHASTPLFQYADLLIGYLSLDTILNFTHSMEQLTNKCVVSTSTRAATAAGAGGYTSAAGAAQGSGEGEGNQRSSIDMRAATSPPRGGGSPPRGPGGPPPPYDVAINMSNPSMSFRMSAEAAAALASSGSRHASVSVPGGQAGAGTPPQGRAAMSVGGIGSPQGHGECSPVWGCGDAR
jgi:hypothetical protein